MMRPLDLGTLEVVDTARDAVVGYVFVERGSNALVETVQRWVLEASFRAPPLYQMTLRSPSDAERAYSTFDAFRSQLRELLSSSGSTYIRAECATFSSIEEIPPYDPEQQIDDGTFQLLQGTEVVGYGCVTRDARVKTEHWVLFNTYVSPATVPLLVGPSDRFGAGQPSFSEFMADMAHTWQPGYTYAPCSCVTEL